MILQKENRAAHLYFGQSVYFIIMIVHHSFWFLWKHKESSSAALIATTKTFEEAPLVGS